VTVARRAHAYPQVEPTAAALVNARLLAVDPRARVGAALAAARKSDVPAVVAGGDVILREDLARASAHGLDDLAARELSRPVPALDASATEVGVRRALAAGAPLVVVREAGRPVGAVVGRAAMPAAIPLGARFARALSDSTARLLALVSAQAAAHGARAWVVGGLVRDAWLGVPGERRDVDVVVEGDGPAVARTLADELGGELVVHERFLTATVVGAAGHLDVITARSERYDAPGALPRVMPAGIAHDLRRRDLTVNAMAVELTTPGFGLLDPHGGRDDLARRRLRVLHPLSFVEDPTRIFRAARYAARFGFALDAWTRRCLALAVRLAPYPALSGRRLVAEIERLAADAAPGTALRRLGTAGAFRLLDRRFRYGAPTAARLAALPETYAWSEAHALAVDRAALAVLAIVADQPPAVVDAALTRLGCGGEPRARLEQALVLGRRLPGALAAAATPSARARLLRERGPDALAWLWLGGGPAVRAAVDWYLGGVPAWEVALRGDELIALGVPRGPEVARVRGSLWDARVDGTVADRAGEAAWVRHWLQTGREG
jgi:tRNA nucleotidyltransferase (CCA-adding enzyme)